jgi:hypothetical protein
MEHYLNANASGIRAYCDRYIASADGELHYASFYGGAEAVKGIVASMLSNNAVIIGERNFVRSKLTMSYESTRLSNAVTHIVVYVPDLFLIDGQATFILKGDTHADVVIKAYDVLMKCRPTPLIEEWRNFITNEQIWVHELESFGIPYAAMINLPSTENLDNFVIENISEL